MSKLKLNYNDNEINAMQEYFKSMKGKVNVGDFSKNFVDQMSFNLKN